jgi:hypothetical protein
MLKVSNDNLNADYQTIIKEAKKQEKKVNKSIDCIKKLYTREVLTKLRTINNSKIKML